MSGKGGPTYDKERISINVARLRKGGEVFEVVVDPDAAITYKETGSKGNVRDVVKAEEVFSDAKKGQHASEEHMQAVFNTNDFAGVARTILDEGEIQLTAEHRDKVRAAKLKKLITTIHRNAIDPKSGNPHPEKRIELAFAEAKVKVDEFKTTEQQLQDVVKKLQPVLPIRFEQARLRVHLPGDHATKLYGEVTRLATLVKEEWRNDGSWEAIVELPAGMKLDLIDLLNDRTHGGASVEEEKKK